jgi:hypothetical protein
MQRALIKLPVPIVTGADPVNTILESPEFQIAREYFTNYPPTSLLHDGGIARAFIYLLICSMGHYARDLGERRRACRYRGSFRLSRDHGSDERMGARAARAVYLA